eukprot:comp21572_c0_seq1/m.47337 comp21572_c0_seq1/g.47337  ORF comp21572_c0_seq1/g.47337 comp21572_c0_seq1/m.47337 type:complete len:369 (-) comp21572_c0_seq1:245-1351(-)
MVHLLQLRVLEHRRAHLFAQCSKKHLGIERAPRCRRGRQRRRLENRGAHVECVLAHVRMSCARARCRRHCCCRRAGFDCVQCVGHRERNVGHELVVRARAQQHRPVAVVGADLCHCRMRLVELCKDSRAFGLVGLHNRLERRDPLQRLLVARIEIAVPLGRGLQIHAVRRLESVADLLHLALKACLHVGDLALLHDADVVELALFGNTHLGHALQLALVAQIRTDLFVLNHMLVLLELGKHLVVQLRVVRRLLGLLLVLLPRDFQQLFGLSELVDFVVEPNDLELGSAGLVLGPAELFARVSAFVTEHPVPLGEPLVFRRKQRQPRFQRKHILVALRDIHLVVRSHFGKLLFQTRNHVCIVPLAVALR